MSSHSAHSASFFAQPTTAPGREGQPTATTQPAGEAAPAGPPPKAPGFDYSMILMIALPVLVIIFMNRSQKKQQAKLEESLAVGTKVVLSGGIVGRIVELAETRARVEIAPGVTVAVLKSAISGPDPAEAQPSAKIADVKDAKDAKDAKPAASEPPAKAAPTSKPGREKYSKDAALALRAKDAKDGKPASIKPKDKRA